MVTPSSARDRRPTLWLIGLLAVAGAAVLWPLMAALVLAGWFAALTTPWMRWLSYRLGRRRHAAAAMTLLLFFALAAPAALLLLSLVTGGAQLLESALHAPSPLEALKQLAGSGPPMHGAKSGFGLADMVRLAREHGQQAAGVAAKAGEAAGWGLVHIFVFFLASYAFLLDGRKVLAWLILHAPVPRKVVMRLAGAAAETGRGLLVSLGLTGLTQGVLTTIVYAALGVPKPLVLGFLTCVCSIVPVLGTPLVWVPVSIGLALSGHTGHALVMAGLGASVIFFVDNVVSPWYAKLGKLKMPTWLLILAIFGGLALLGPWGVLLGPLWVRLASEAFAIAREAGVVGPAASIRKRRLARPVIADPARPLQSIPPLDQGRPSRA